MASHLKPQLERFLATESDTLELGAALARGITPGLVVFLSGELGAGKTTIARGLLHALGEPGRVKSPTFTLVEPYKFSKLYLYHFDFYRFEGSDELDDAGFRDYFNPESVALIEWPEKAADRLPAPDLVIELTVQQNGRHVAIDALTQAGIHCLEQMRRFFEPKPD